MNLFIYSDESGVFDQTNQKYFVFGGIILLSKKEKDSVSRKFIAVEKEVRKNINIGELKASRIAGKQKRRLFGSLNGTIKWGVVINQGEILEPIFKQKKSKQRYLDYAYKIGLKNALICLNNEGALCLSDIENIYVFCDEHTTATDGKYELREALLQEFKEGTFNQDYNYHWPPIIPNLKSIDLMYCNSESTTLIRAADITANYIYHHCVKGKALEFSRRIIIKELPKPFMQKPGDEKHRR